MFARHKCQITLSQSTRGSRGSLCLGVHYSLTEKRNRNGLPQSYLKTPHTIFLWEPADPLPIYSYIRNTNIYKCMIKFQKVQTIRSVTASLCRISCPPTAKVKTTLPWEACLLIGHWSRLLKNDINNYSAEEQKTLHQYQEDSLPQSC